MKKFKKPPKSKKFSRKQLVSMIASLRGELTSLVNGVSVVLAKEEVKRRLDQRILDISWMI